MRSRDLRLLVLRVAGDADDLHAVHEGRRDVQRVGRRHEHDVGEIIVDLEIVVVEARVLLGVEHFEQRRGRVAAEVLAHLVDLVEQEQRVGRLGLAHRLDDLAGHRADVSAPMPSDLRLVAHAAERNPHEFPSRGLGDGSTQGRLAHARRTHEAQDRSRELVGAALNREIFDDALLHLVEPVMVRVQRRLSERQIPLDLGALVPRDRQQPIEVIAHDRRLGRHGRHLLQLLELGLSLVSGFLRKLGFLDASLELRQIVLAVLVPEFLLDGLHLLVEIILPLGLLHLTLDARPDALLDLQDRDLALHQAEALLQPRRDGRRFEDPLLVGDLHREMLGDLIGELGIVGDLTDGRHHLRRNLLVQLDVVFELADHRAGQRLHLDLVERVVGQRLGIGLIKLVGADVFAHLGAPGALDQHLDGAVRQLQELQHGSERSGREDGVGGWIVVGRVHLRGQQDELVGLHHVLESADRFLPTHKEGDDHVGEHDDIAQRQHRIGIDRPGGGGHTFLAGHAASYRECGARRCVHWTADAPALPDRLWRVADHATVSTVWAEPTMVRGGKRAKVVSANFAPPHVMRTWRPW